MSDWPGHQAWRHGAAKPQEDTMATTSQPNYTPGSMPPGPLPMPALPGAVSAVDANTWRGQALAYAHQIGGTVDAIIENAQAFFHFLRGANDGVPDVAPRPVVRSASGELGYADPAVHANPANVGNVGNGTIVFMNSKVGDHKVVATSATDWKVTDPAGDTLPDATTGVAYSSGQISFTITAGSVPFAAGDSFTIT
jgi:hypothetical protein